MERINRINRLSVRVTDEEYQDLVEQADVSGLSLSEYVRRRVFGRRVVSKLDLKVLAELRRLGGLLKHVHTTSGGTYSKLTADAIQALASYARQMERNLRPEK